MPTTQQDLEEQRKRLREAGAKATRLSGVGSTFIANVREELRKRAQDKGVTQLGQQASSARKEFAAAPSRIREQYKDIDPYKRMSAVAERKGSILAELEDIADLKSQRQAGVTDILEGMRSGIQAETEQAKYSTQLEQQLYGNMFGEYKLQLEDQWKQADFALKTKQAEANQLYQQGMLAYYNGQIDVAEDRLAESERSNREAERLNAEKLRIEEELGYAGLASQERVAGMRISSKAPPAPTYGVTLGDQTISGLSAAQKLAYETAVSQEAAKKKTISNVIGLYKTQGKKFEEIADMIIKAGYSPAEFADELAGYQAPKKESFWSRLNPWD